MDNFFSTGLVTILILSFALFWVLAYLSFVWMNRKATLANLLGASMVSVIHIFKIAVISLLFLGIVSFIISRISLL